MIILLSKGLHGRGAELLTIAAYNNSEIMPVYINRYAPIKTLMPDKYKATAYKIQGDLPVDISDSALIKLEEVIEKETEDKTFIKAVLAKVRKEFVQGANRTIIVEGVRDGELGLFTSMFGSSEVKILEIGENTGIGSEAKEQGVECATIEGELTFKKILSATLGWISDCEKGATKISPEEAIAENEKKKAKANAMVGDQEKAIIFNFTDGIEVYPEEEEDSKEEADTSNEPDQDDLEEELSRYELDEFQLAA